MSYTEKQFTIGALEGISEKAISEHLKLYAGYVKHTNLIMDKIAELSSTAESAEKNAYAIAEMQRRFAFEFDGMRNHEYYFEQFEWATPSTSPASFVLTDSSTLLSQINKDFGSYDAWLSRFKTIAMTRGIGWAILYYDKSANKLVNSWVDEQHLGHLTGLEVVVALDMWEHSYLFDYVPAEKKKYIEAFFANINPNVIEKRFDHYTQSTK